MVGQVTTRNYKNNSATSIVMSQFHRDNQRHKDHTMATIARFGTTTCSIPSEQLGQLREANALLDDLPALRARMAEDGYLLIRGFHDRAEVLDARRAIMQGFAARCKPGTDPMDGIVGGEGGGAFAGVDKPEDQPEFRRVVDGERPLRFFDRFLGDTAMTFTFKWLRLVGPGEATGAHLDTVYMGRGTPNLFTVWTPFGDITYDQGPLAILVGSHRLESFAKVQNTYGQMDVDRDRVDGWFSDQPLELAQRFGGQWATSEFRAGDALIFGMRTMHASLVHTSDRFRLSADARYQRQSDPKDERWIGERPIGHYAWHSEPDKMVPMTTARAQWEV